MSSLFDRALGAPCANLTGRFGAPFCSSCQGANHHPLFGNCPAGMVRLRMPFDTNFVAPGHPGPASGRPEYMLVAGHPRLAFSKEDVNGRVIEAFTPVFDGLCPTMTECWPN